MRVGTGNTKVGTKLDFNIMANPFKIQTLTESKAKSLIKKNGFGFKTVKSFNKVVCVVPLGSEEDVYSFLENCIENKISTFNGGITVK